MGFTVRLNTAFLCTVLICGCVEIVSSYQAGAPATACVSMTPQHSGTAAQTGVTPFEVSVVNPSFKANQTITVMLSSKCGDVKFGGFLLEARRADVGLNRNEPLGTFNINQADLSKHVFGCGNGQQAVTHTNDSPKERIAFVWTAPPQTVGHIVFVATFAETKQKYWLKVYSKVILDETLDSNVNTGTETYPTPSRTCIGPTEQTTKDSSMITVGNGCGVRKSCFSNCNNSVCDFIISWTNASSNSNPHTTVFELTTVSKRNTNTWMAIGFSEDQEMGDDFVVECVAFNNVINMYTSYNKKLPFRENERNEKPHPSDGVYKQHASLSDGIFRCSFIIETNPFSYINLAKPWYLMFATGLTATFRDTKLKHVTIPGKYPPVTTLKIDFTGNQTAHEDGIVNPTRPGNDAGDTTVKDETEPGTYPPVTSGKIDFTGNQTVHVDGIVNPTRPAIRVVQPLLLWSTGLCLLRTFGHY